MSDFDEEVKIVVGTEPDENSAKQTGKKLSKAVDEEYKKQQQRVRNIRKGERRNQSAYDELEKAEAARLEKTVELEKRKLALKGQSSKEAKAEKAELDKQLEVLRQENLESVIKRESIKQRLADYASEKQAIEEILAMRKGEGSNVVEYTDKDIKALEAVEKTAKSAQQAIDDATGSINNNINGTGTTIKKTAKQIKLETQKIVDTFSQQPSKDFAKAENDRIKLLQQSLAEATRKMQELGQNLTGPWKLQVDIHSAQSELADVTKEIDNQKSEVEKLKQAYEEAEAKASDIRSAIQSGTYSTEELVFEMQKVQGAEADAKRAGQAYSSARAKLDSLIQRQNQLGESIQQTTQKYQQMVAELKEDSHNDQKVEMGEAAYAEYREAVKTVEQLRDELEDVYQAAKDNDIIKKEDLEVAKQIEETLKGIGNEVKNIQSTGNLFGELGQSTEETIANNKKLIAQYNKQISAAKQSAAQYYYQVRAVKMLGFVVNQVYTTMDKFGKKTVQVASSALKSYLKLIPGVSLLQKRLSKATATQKQFAKETKNVNNSSKQFNFTLKDLIKNVLKYGIGIRSLFVLFNKLRSAMMFGFENMAKQFDAVNKPLSSLLTSFTMMKNAVSTAVQPLVNILAPILEKISALFSDVTYKIASFIAALTGKSTVYKAVRVQQDYAASLDKTAKSAKKAKQELSGLDKLNVINSDKSSGDDSAGNFFEEVPVDSTMADWAKKFKDFINRLLDPIKKAWEKMKDYVIDSWKFMCGKLKSLWEAVAETFWRVWDEEATQKIFEDIFKIVGDIMNIVGTLAGKIEEAWRANDNGYRILSTIRDIIGSIVSHIEEMTSATLEWVESLTLVPLFTAIADVLQKQVKPAIDEILDLVVYLYTDFVLPLTKDFIENNLPKLVRACGNIAESVGDIAKNVKKALKFGNKGKKIVEKIEKIAGKVCDTIEEMSKDTKDWAKDLNFNPLFDSLDKFLEKIQPALDFLLNTVKKLWKDVVLPFWKYMIEEGGPKLLDLLGKIFGDFDSDTGLGIDWEHLTEVIGKFLDTLEPFFELAWETLLQVVEKLGKKFDDFVNSGSLDKIVDSFSKWVDEADPKELASWIIGLTEAFMGMYGVVKLFATVIFPLVSGFMVIKNVINQQKMISTVADLTKKIEALNGSMDTAVGTIGTEGGTGFAGALGTAALWLGVVAGAVADVALAAENVRLKDISDQAKDFPQTASDMNGINEEMNAFERVLKRIYEITHPGETLADRLIAPSDYEKLETMKDHLIVMGDHLENDGKLTEEMGGKIDEALDIWLSHGERMEDLTDEEAQHFSDLYKSVEEYYNIINDTEESTSKVEQFANNVVGFFQDIKNKLIGDPIVYDIRDGVDEGFSDFINTTTSNLAEWVKTVVGDFSTMDSDIGNTLKGAKDTVFKKFSEMGGSIKEKGAEAVETAREKFSSIKDKAEEFLSHSKFAKIGENTTKGLNSGIQYSKVISTVSKGDAEVMRTFQKDLKPSLLSNVGKNLTNALSSGLNSGLPSLLSTATNICSSVIGKFTSMFKISSPSKIFTWMGHMLDAGLEKGVEDGSEDVVNSFDNMVPSDSMLESFYDKFIDMVTELTTNSVALFDAMFIHIEDSMRSLESLMSMSNLYSSLDKIPVGNLPSIVNGQTLPSNKEFRQSSAELDLSKLPDIIKNAVIEAITDTADLQTDDGDTIIEIDGREIFRVVRNENSQYKKQHGASAFA